MLEKNYQNDVAELLINIKSIKFSFKEPFTLTSGSKSPVYVDCRRIISFIKERNIILKYANEYFNANQLNFDILAGGETAGIPYAAILSEQLQKKMIYIRKQPKSFGKNQQIEGQFEKGEKAILIEDLATDGGSKITFVNAMLDAGLKVEHIFVIFHYDIFDYSLSPLSNLNIKIHSLCTWKDIINVIQKKKIFENSEIDNLKKFLNNPEEWRRQNA